jgi:hypothetical protein
MAPPAPSPPGRRPTPYKLRRSTALGAESARAAANREALAGRGCPVCGTTDLVTVTSPWSGVTCQKVRHAEGCPHRAEAAGSP